MLTWPRSNSPTLYFCPEHAGAPAAIVDTGITLSASPWIPAISVDADRIYVTPTTPSTTSYTVTEPTKPLGEHTIDATFSVASDVSALCSEEDDVRGLSICRSMVPFDR